MMITVGGNTFEASLVYNEGAAVLAYQGRPGLFTSGRNYSIDGLTFRVLSSAPSQYVPTITLVKLKEI